MKWTAKEGQVAIAGYVGNVEKRTDGLTSVSIANRKGKEEVEWLNVAFTNPKEAGPGPRLADLANNYVRKGQFIAVVANEVQNGQYTNYYAVAVELGPNNKQA